MRRQLAQAEEEADRLVVAIAGGILVEDLKQQMQEVEARRQRLREELEAVAGDGAEGLDVIPGLASSAMADLRTMIDAGEMRAVRRAMPRMVMRIDVKGAKVPGRKRPEPRLYLHTDLPGLLMFAAEKSRRVVAGACYEVYHDTWSRARSIAA